MRSSLLTLTFFILVALYCSTMGYAGIHQAPNNFNTRYGKAVFIDFLSARYELKINTLIWASLAISSIEFTMPERGLPIFDSVNSPTDVFINGQRAQDFLIDSPDKVTKLRIINKTLAPGRHHMVIYTPLRRGISLGPKGVSASFFIRDLKDRKLLEKYIPSNLEYDQYSMTFDIQVVNSSKNYKVYANGDVTAWNAHNFQVTYPPHYTASSVYFHLVPADRYKETHFNFQSVSGREIPITIYSNFWNRNAHFKEKIIEVLTELENDYGPYPHPKLLVYGRGFKGGMEYVGATETSLVSLGHELQHMYFAKGVMPANGNSGWMDEAIASWRDRGHQECDHPHYDSHNLGQHSQYQRKTNKRSYAVGRSFIAYLDFKLKDLGAQGMKDFLKIYAQKRMFTTVTTEDFISDLNMYAGFDFRADFDRFIFSVD